MTTHTCDCGQPAQKHDGSGWFCLECERMVKTITALIRDAIRRQRRHTRDRAAYMRDYAQRNRARIAAYQRQYNREWKRKNLLRMAA